MLDCKDEDTMMHFLDAIDPDKIHSYKQFKNEEEANEYLKNKVVNSTKNDANSKNSCEISNTFNSNDNIFVVFCSGNENYEFDNQESAKTMRNMVHEECLLGYMSFSTQQNYESFKNNLNRKSFLPSVKTDSNPYSKNKSSTIVSNSVVQSPGSKSQIESNPSSPFAQAMVHQASAARYKIRLHIFDYKKEFAGALEPSTKPIAIDFISTINDKTIWNHKPDLWAQIFKGDSNFSKEDGGMQIDPFFHSFTNCWLRDEPSKNEVKKYTTKTGNNIQLSLLYCLVPVDWTIDQICSELKKGVGFVNNQSIRTVYKNMNASNITLEAYIQQLDEENGYYWKNFEAALTCDYDVVNHNILAEIFMDSDISNIIQKMFNHPVKTPVKIWKNEILKFAYGTTT